MKSAYFGQCSCGINIDQNNYPEETELDTNPTLTLARTLTLSTGELISGHFTFSRCYTTIVNFAFINSPKNLGRDPESRSEIDLKRKITIAWNWRLKNKYTGNRSWRKWVSDHVFGTLSLMDAKCPPPSLVRRVAHFCRFAQTPARASACDPDQNTGPVSQLKQPGFVLSLFKLGFSILL